MIIRACALMFACIAFYRDTREHQGKPRYSRVSRFIAIHANIRVWTLIFMNIRGWYSRVSRSHALTLRISGAFWYSSNIHNISLDIEISYSISAHPWYSPKKCPWYSTFDPWYSRSFSCAYCVRQGFGR